MAGGVKLTGARGSGARGHGSEIRRHREKAGEEGNSPRPSRRPEEKVGAAAAMADGQELTALADWAIQITKRKMNRMGRERGPRRAHHGRETEVGTARRRRRRGRRGRRSAGLLRAAVSAGTRRKRSGAAGGARGGGVGCLLTRPRQREDSHDARRGRGCAAA